ncbi:hypothetical protein SAMN05443572_1021020 [Myxococcus fulvus]|uniref:Lipoprotein n=1 Tax=Myxococcus fulvus TaxID=33 RepID=A0A511SVC8_MYXFU|nr:hypothetical protein [Myxococcus fulvus]GEN05859.1 hypothetical protein MFU01_08960 [Myxococcus fulvus]SET65174.1 hypothetical protein SAMN05443572_1021020 [Myxococcus fulvus]
MRGFIALAAFLTLSGWTGRTAAPAASPEESTSADIICSRITSESLCRIKGCIWDSEFGTCGD